VKKPRQPTSPAKKYKGSTISHEDCLPRRHFYSNRHPADTANWFYYDFYSNAAVVGSAAAGSQPSHIYGWLRQHSKTAAQDIPQTPPSHKKKHRKQVNQQQPTGNFLEETAKDFSKIFR